MVNRDTERQQFELMTPTTEVLIERHLIDRSGERLPIDWRDIPTKQFNLDRDVPMPELYAEIRRSYDGWLPFLQERFDLSDGVVASLGKARYASYLVGTVTEDNLPGYSLDISQTNQPAPAHTQEILATGAGIWRAEEDAHGRALNAFGELTDLLSGVDYTRARTSQLRHGSSATPHGLMHMKVYTSLQEPMANIAHQKDSALHEAVGHGILQAIAADEARHGRWFRGEVLALAETFPDELITELYGVVTDFRMPGSKGIPNYKRLSAIIAGANLLTEEDFRSTVVSAIHQWGVQDLLPKTEQAKHMQALLLDEFLQPKSDDFMERIVKPGRFVLGHTLTIAQLRQARAEYKATLVKDASASVDS